MHKFYLLTWFTILFTKSLTFCSSNDMLFAISLNLFLSNSFAKKSNKKKKFSFTNIFFCVRFFKFPSKKERKKKTLNKTKKRRKKNNFIISAATCGSVKRKSAANDFKAFWIWKKSYYLNICIAIFLFCCCECEPNSRFSHQHDRR